MDASEELVKAAKAKPGSKIYVENDEYKKAIIHMHFNHAFKYFRPRFYLKGLNIVSLNHYTLIFWCSHMGTSRKPVGQLLDRCTCEFTMSCRLPRFFVLSKESLNEIKNQTNARGTLFPQICVPRY